MNVYIMYEFYYVSCMNIIFNKLHQQRVKYDVDTTRKIKFIHAIFYHILFLLIIYPLFYLELFCNAQQYSQAGVSWPKLMTQTF